MKWHRRYAELRASPACTTARPHGCIVRRRPTLRSPARSSTAAQLPLWAEPDLEVPEAIPRRCDQPAADVADPMPTDWPELAARAMVTQRTVGRGAVGRPGHAPRDRPI